MNKIKVAVIGGSGIYKLDAIKVKESIKVETPFGNPSADIMICEIDGNEFYFLPRHGHGHHYTPTEVNYRANIFVYNDIDKSLYSMLSVYVGIRVLDIILTGRPSKKIVNIVSNNVEVLKEQIRERIEEHGTILTGIGLHQGQNKTIIYVTVDAGKIDLLKNLITKYDPDAFMIITEASEFLGRGLK
jgi:hypothetical protein